MEKLTAVEEEAMLIVWHLGGGVTKDFLNEYPEPKPPYTTLASVMKNLERKGFLQTKRYGPTYYYSPLIDEQEYKRSSLSGFVKRYFADSYKSMISFFVKDDNISTDELKEILSHIEEKHENNTH